MKFTNSLFLAVALFLLAMANGPVHPWTGPVIASSASKNPDALPGAPCLNGATACAREVTTGPDALSASPPASWRASRPHAIAPPRTQRAAGDGFDGSGVGPGAASRVDLNPMPGQSPSALPGDLDASFGTGGLVTTPFDPTTGADATDIAIQPDGKVVAVGYSGLPDEFAIARYNPDGSLDTTFGAGGKVTTDISADRDLAYSVAIDGEGKVIVAGTAGLFTAAADFALARYNPDGSLDTTFGTGGVVTSDFSSTGSGDEAWGLALQPDGKIVVAGRTFGLGGDFAVARYNPDGSLDTGFGTGGLVNTDFGRRGTARAIVLQPDGKLIVAGQTSGFSDFALARYNPDGSLDASFGAGGKVTTTFVESGNDLAWGVALQPDGKIVLAGSTSTCCPTDGAFALARYNSNGSLDQSFGTGGKVTTEFNAQQGARDVAVLADGRIVAVGEAFNGEDNDFAVAVYRPDGTLDPTFGSGGKVTTDFNTISNDSYESAWGVALQPDSKIIAVGSFTGQTTEFALARYLAPLPSGQPHADLEVTKADDPDPVFAESDLTYTLTVTNHGPDAATGVTLTDTLPQGVSLVSATPGQGSCSGTDTITCDLGDIPVGASATVTIEVTALEPGEIANTAAVSAAEPDFNPANDTATATTRVDESEHILYYHYDATGNVVAMTDVTGRVAWRADLRPFGQGTASPPERPLRFTGQPREEDIGEEDGLYHLGARTFDPLAGRFLSPDPLPLEDVKRENPQRFNRYSYALNNPYRFHDASGLEPVSQEERQARTALRNFINFVEAKLGPNPDFFQRVLAFSYGPIAPPAPIFNTNNSRHFFGAPIRNKAGQEVDLDWGARLAGIAVATAMKGEIGLATTFSSAPVYPADLELRAKRVVRGLYGPSKSFWNAASDVLTSLSGGRSLTGPRLPLSQDPNILGIDLLIEYIIYGGDLRSYFDPKQVPPPPKPSK